MRLIDGLRPEDDGCRVAQLDVFEEAGGRDCMNTSRSAMSDIEVGVSERLLVRVFDKLDPDGTQ